MRCVSTFWSKSVDEIVCIVSCHDAPLWCWSWTVNGGTRAHLALTDYANTSSTKDAFVLGRLLAHPLTTLSNMPAALKAYQDVRLPFAQFIARGSERMGNILQFCLPGYYDGSDRGNMREEIEILKEKIMDQWGWEGEGTVAQWVQAESKLREDLCQRGEDGA